MLSQYPRALLVLHHLHTDLLSVLTKLMYVRQACVSNGDEFLDFLKKQIQMQMEEINEETKILILANVASVYVAVIHIGER